MKNLVKLKEWTKEEIHEQIINGDIDHDFICEYISSRDRVYNKLIDRVIELESVLKEIREYTKSHFKGMVADEEAQGLLEIIDKGIGEDK